MLRSANKFMGYKIEAKDGHLGKVADLYFDDHRWIVRYIVVDTGTWLPDRQVLVSPLSVGEPDWKERIVPVSLTVKQVEEAPGVEKDLPVSRRLEAELARYYNWAPYWGAPMGPVPVVMDRSQVAVEEENKKGDPNLRSTREVTGYHIRAIGGQVGHVEDFVVRTGAWMIQYMVVDTRNWLPGRKVLIAPGWIRHVDWAEEAVDVDLAVDAIKESPTFDPATPINREYEERLYDYYGRPKYWMTG